MARTYVELAPGVYRIPTFPLNSINSFAFTEADGSVTLLDAGLKSAPKRVLTALHELGKAPSDVGRLILSHAHADHAGGAKGVQAATPARVHVHDHEADFVRTGTSPIPDRRTWAGRLVGLFPRNGGFAPIEVDETFADGDLLDVGGGLRVVHTPGHTPGHVSFVHEPSGTLITGDAIFNVRGITYSPKLFCHDVAVSRETADRLGELDYEVAAFTHGRELRVDAREKIRQFLFRRRHPRSGP